jgi:hypothetical protein
VFSLTNLDRWLWARRLRNKRAHLEVLYRSGGRHQNYSLTSDGALTARPNGGPKWSRGSVMNQEHPTVGIWRGVADPELHKRLCEALIEAGFPMPYKPYSLVADEHISEVKIKRSKRIEDIMPAVSNLRRAHPLLGDALNKLEYTGYCLIKDTDPDGYIPNPELHRWTDNARTKARQTEQEWRAAFEKFLPEDRSEPQ